DSGAAAGLGGWNAGAAAPGLARPAPRPPAPAPRDRGRPRHPVLGGIASPDGRPSLRPAVGRDARARPRDGEAGMNERLRVAILAPVWFQVPPPGYGGIEWIVALLADGLAEVGHDVTLFASGDSHTKAQLSFVFEHAPSHLIGQSLVELE